MCASSKDHWSGCLCFSLKNTCNNNGQRKAQNISKYHLGKYSRKCMQPSVHSVFIMIVSRMKVWHSVWFKKQPCFFFRAKETQATLIILRLNEDMMNIYWSDLNFLFLHRHISMTLPACFRKSTTRPDFEHQNSNLYAISGTRTAQNTPDPNWTPSQRFQYPIRRRL